MTTANPTATAPSPFSLAGLADFLNPFVSTGAFNQLYGSGQSAAAAAQTATGPLGGFNWLILLLVAAALLFIGLKAIVS